MKLLSFALVGFSALSAVAAQKGCSKISGMSPGKPVIRTTAQRKYFVVPHGAGGVFSLKPNPNAAKGDGHSHGGGGKGGMMGGMGGMMGEGDSQTFMPSLSGSTFCGTCTVLSGQIKIFYEDGTPANVTNGIYVHHILTNGARTDAGQPFINLGLMGQAGASGNGFVGAGDDNGNKPWTYAPKTNDKFESGYHMSPNLRFNTQIVLVNYNKVAKNVCVAYDLEYLPGHVGKKIKATLISSAGPGGFKAKGAGSKTGSKMSFSESGYIVSAKGHLHDGGVSVLMEVNGKNKHSCTSVATYGHTNGGTGQKTISDMSECQPMPWRIEKGDTMQVTSRWDMKAHPGRETTSGGAGDMMGMIRVIFAPDKMW